MIKKKDFVKLQEDVEKLQKFRDRDYELILGQDAHLRALISEVNEQLILLCDYLGVEITQPNQKRKVVKKEKGGE